MAVYDYFGKVMAETGKSARTFSGSSVVNGQLTGTAANETFIVNTAPAGTVFVGGAGDDRYYSVNMNTKIVETANGGIDTVAVIGNYVMPDFIENATIGYADGIVGNKLANYIVGSARGQSIDGGQGNDVLSGGGGADRFVFGAHSGYDVITDFVGGANPNAKLAPETISLAGYTAFKTFADVKAALTQVGTDVVLKLSGSDAVKLLNIKVADLSADNFLYTVDRSHQVQTFNEDFNSLSLWDGQNGGVWRTDFGWGNDRNLPMARSLSAQGEKQYYVDPYFVGKVSKEEVGINPFSVKDGVLTIHAAPVAADQVDDLYGYQFTSGLLSTRNSFTQTYGYFEARMQLADGEGAWPAFWLYGANASELDIMESKSGEMWGGTTHDHANGKDDQMSTNGIFTPDLSTGFHTYGVLWTAETVTWYLDGAAVRTIATPASMHSPMYLMVNLALDNDTAADFKGADMQVDYVRAYGLDNLPGTLVKGVTGTASNEYLSGTTGADRLAGLTGNDTYYVDNARDVVIENAGEGTDTVRAAVNWTLGANLENLVLVGKAVSGTGNDVANFVTGNELDNVLTALGGDDVIDGGRGADRMIGGTGGDTYYVDNARDVIVENAGEGTDVVYASVNYVLSANIEKLILTGAAIQGTGNDSNNPMFGNELNNTLIGNGGADYLDGRAGADTMIGGTGADTYIVDNVGDVVIEKAGEGWDQVQSSVDYTLTDNVETLSLTGTAIRGTANNGGATLYGNDLGNILTGGAGTDTIDGRAGNDRIIGGAGADRLTGGAGADTFVFAAGFGKDIVADFKIGEDSIDWSALVKAYGAPVITDVKGVATATFGADAITFVGLKAADLIAGDVFSRSNPSGRAFVDATAPVATAPVVTAPVVTAPVVTPPVVTPPVVTPPVVTAPVVTAPVVTPPVVTPPVVTPPVVTAPVIPVPTPDPTPVDTTPVEITPVQTVPVEPVPVDPTPVSPAPPEPPVETAPVVTAPVVTPPVVAPPVATVPAATAPVVTAPVVTAPDPVSGGKTMTGTSANDMFLVNSVLDKVIEKANGGIDTIKSSVDYTLSANVESLVLTGNAVTGIGNALDNLIMGNDLDNKLYGGAGNDKLMGGLGADMMAGGTGNDTYWVDHAGGQVIELANEGYDTVYASIDYTLGANLEKLILDGSAVKGTGNDLANTIIGNELANVLTGGGGNDWLDGGAGADRLIGGTGGDTYIVDHVGDVVIEQVGEGNDTVYASVDYTAPANVERLVLTGTAQIGTAGATAITLTGNASDNILTGSAKNDIINGNGGNDRIVGGAGNDRLVGGTGHDTFAFDTGFGKDTITDFNVNEDAIDWSALAGRSGAPTMRMSGNNAVVSFGSDTITFLGVNVADLQSHHVFG